MAFVSARMPKEFVIDDSNYQQHCGPLSPTIDGRGRVPRDWAKMPYGSHPVATKFDIPLIPRSDWAAMIQEREERGGLLSQAMLKAGVKSLDQNGTNYCWCNGVVTGMLAIAAFSGPGPIDELSPASAAAQIKDYRNEGGWGGDALEWISQHGIYLASEWPPNARERKYKTAAGDASALGRKITEWYELSERNFDQKMTCLLLGLPVPSGYNYWSHEVCGIDPVIVEPGHFGSRERNSWGEDYGDHGFFILSENKATPDDAVVPRVRGFSGT